MLQLAELSTQIADLLLNTPSAVHKAKAILTLLDPSSREPDEPSQTHELFDVLATSPSVATDRPQAIQSLVTLLNDSSTPLEDLIAFVEHITVCNNTGPFELQMPHYCTANIFKSGGTLRIASHLLRGEVKGLLL